MTIQAFNEMDIYERSNELYRCCGSKAWVKKMQFIFPLEELVELLSYAEKNWYECSEQDWLEAFSQHPRIGERKNPENKYHNTAAWAASEQAGTEQASPGILHNLKEANRKYEEKFGFVFIICATGKPAEEMLEALEKRMLNDREEELKIAVDEQNKITQLRLQKLLS